MAILTESTATIHRPVGTSPAADVASGRQGALVWTGMLIACLVLWGFVVLGILTVLGIG